MKEMCLTLSVWLVTDPANSTGGSLSALATIVRCSGSTVLSLRPTLQVEQMRPELLLRRELSVALIAFLQRLHVVQSGKYPDKRKSHNSKYTSTPERSLLWIDAAS